MANLQLQTVTKAETTTQIAIDQKQSLEVVQAMLHGALSCVAYFRFFFPEKAFDRQIYTLSGNLLSYPDYQSGDCTTDGTWIPVLKRNRSKRADVFLDWLEKGAFGTLKDGNLRALQIYVHPDYNEREKVIETYTITIAYLGGPKGVRTPRGLEITGDGSESISMDFTTKPRKALLALLRQIQKSCSILPGLPAKRYVSMEMFFLPNEPDSRQKEGWILSNATNKYFAQAVGWRRQTDQFNELHSGFHSTSFEIRHLQDLSALRCLPNLPLPKKKFPRSFQCSEHFSKFEFERLASLNDSSEGGGKDVSGGFLSATSAPSTAIANDSVNKSPARKEDSNILQRAAGSFASVPIARNSSAQRQPDRSQGVHQIESQRSDLAFVNSPRFHDDSVNTQARSAHEMGAALQKMLQPENLTQGDTQSQAPGFYLRDEDSISQGAVFETNAAADVTTARFAINERPVLSQTNTNRLKEIKMSLRLAAHKHWKLSPSLAGMDDIVLCQCGINKDEGGTVLCEYCETWQHLACYGYLGPEDSRLPEVHVCYQCLLGNQETQVLQKLCSLTLWRRGVHLAMESGLEDGRKFAEDLGLRLLDANSLKKHLCSEGFLVPESRSREVGKTGSIRSRLVAVKHGPKYEKMLRELFDPMLHISHHYGLPAGAEAPRGDMAKCTSASRRKSKPSSDTPAERLSKQKNAETAGSELDLRASLTPFKTPSRNSSRVMQKRARQGDDDDSHPASKRKFARDLSVNRLRSVQTEVVLNVDGLSSSPTAC